MNFLEYPIDYPFRPSLLAVEWLIIIICFELGIFFLINDRRKMIFFNYLQKFGYSTLFVSFGLMRFFTLLSDFYSLDSYYRLFFLEMRYVSMTFGALLFIFFTEKSKKYLIIKYFFTITTLIFMMLFLIFILIGNSLSIFFYLLIWLFFIIFLIIHAIGLVKNIPYLENYRLNIFKFLFLILLLIFGNVISLDIFNLYMGHEIRLLGSILQLICICLIFRFLIIHPINYEFNWRNVVEDIYILSLSGASLFHQSYSNINKKPIDASLVSGAISTVNIILKKLTLSQGKGIGIMRKKGANIYIYTGKYCVGTLISKEDIGYLKYYLKKLIERIEIIYKNVFEDWKGELQIFHPIKSIIEEIFPK